MYKVVKLFTNALIVQTIKKNNFTVNHILHMLIR